MKKIVAVAILIMFFCGSAFSQNDSSFLHRFLTPADTFHKKRFTVVLSTEAVLYGSATVALYQFWYKDYPLNDFHFFNDNGEWLQQDKMGHFYTAYFETNITQSLYNWTGMKDENTYWASGLSGSLFQLTIEVFDGFSEKWGFSPGDLAANTLGAGLSVAQNYAWHEQRFRVKFSSHFIDYSQYGDDVAYRAKQLFGTSGPEKVLKDYNGLTEWVSVNPSMFMKTDTKFPKWLMFSVGYSADGLLGGYENKWGPDPDIKPEDYPPEDLIDRSDIDRYRQYYLSVDLDLSQIHTNSAVVNTIFQILNIVKFPAPAIEFNQGHGVKFRPLYF